jgi:hypothetical protein
MPSYKNPLGRMKEREAAHASTASVLERPGQQAVEGAGAQQREKRIAMRVWEWVAIKREPPLGGQNVCHSQSC